jgi:hypothetical protein
MYSVTWGMCTGLSGIRNHNGQWTEIEWSLYIPCCTHGDIPLCMWLAVSCRMHVTWDIHTGLSKILIHNEQSTVLVGACVYIPSYRCDNIPIVVTDHWIHSLTLHYTVTTVTLFNISTVMLGFWLCQFNTDSLDGGLCLSSTIEFLVLQHTYHDNCTNCIMHLYLCWLFLYLIGAYPKRSMECKI